MEIYLDIRLYLNNNESIDFVNQNILFTFFKYRVAINCQISLHLVFRFSEIKTTYLYYLISVTNFSLFLHVFFLYTLVMFSNQTDLTSKYKSRDRALCNCPGEIDGQSAHGI